MKAKNPSNLELPCYTTPPSTFPVSSYSEIALHSDLTFANQSDCKNLSEAWEEKSKGYSETSIGLKLKGLVLMFYSWSCQAVKISLRVLCASEPEGYVVSETCQACFQTTAFALVSPELETKSNQT